MGWRRSKACLALLIDTKHHGFIGRIQIEPHNVAHVFTNTPRLSSRQSPAEIEGSLAGSDSGNPYGKFGRYPEYQVTDTR
jgi:hypothetical protein